MSERYISRSTEIAARVLGGEMMIMSAVDSTFFTLNESATAVWQAADGRTPLSQIVDRAVCSQFEVDPEVARRDVENFVEELSRHGILKIADQPFDDLPSGSPEAA